MQSIGMLALCYVFDRIEDKIKHKLSISEYNPQLIHTENDWFDSKHSYAMYLLFDMNESSLPLQIASLCVEYSTGYGLSTADDADYALSVIINDRYGQISDKHTLMQQLDDFDTRFVDDLHKSLTHGEVRGLAKLWIKNQMIQIYSVKPIYALMLCLSTTPMTLYTLRNMLKLNK